MVKRKKKGHPNKIKEWRKRRGLTQTALAERIERDQATVQRYEAGTIDIPSSALHALAHALSCSIQDLGVKGPDIASEVADAVRELPADAQMQALKIVRALKAA